MALRAVLWCGIWLLCSVASGALASTAVVIPPHVEAGIAADDTDSAVQELVRLIKAHGFDVISPGQAAAAAEDAQQSGSFPKHIQAEACRDSECATEYRKLFDASIAVQLSLSARRGKVQQVAVAVSESLSAYFTASASVEGGDLKGAVQGAYGAARDKQLRGEGPWLSVEGGPAGAQVYLDGIEYGSVPFAKRHIEAGSHKLEVRSDGFISHVATLQVPSRIDHEERVNVALLPLTAQAEAPLDRTWDYVVGGAFAVLGAVHMGMGIQQKLKAGDCARRNEAGLCVEAYGDEQGVARENLLLGLGGASLVMGGAIMWGAPIARVRLHAAKDTALLSVTGGF